MVLVLSTVLLPARVTSAQETSNDQDESTSSPWVTDLTLYGWLTTSVETDAHFRNIDVSTELDLDDVLDVLDIATFTHLELNNGRWGMFTDLAYIKLSDESTIKRTRGIFRPTIEVDSSLEQIMIELGGYRRFSDEKKTFDFLIGGRYWDISGDIETTNRERDFGRDWVDPFIGGRFGYKFSEKWTSSVRFDIGGFGVGSKSTFNIQTAMNRKINESTSIGVGYRLLDVEYDEENPELDIQMSGPIVGVTFRF